mgnify:FL=1
MSRQFVAVRFNEWSNRPYPYHNDGEPLAIGDVAKVPDPKEDGWKRVEVMAIVDDAPAFPTKAILGKIEEE